MNNPKFNNFTVTLDVDEYYNLRTRAEMNSFLMERLGRFDAILMDIERRVKELENKNK